MKVRSCKYVGRCSAVATVSATVVALAACGGGGGDAALQPTPVNASITTGLTSPAQGALDVPVNSKITLDFSVGAGTYDSATVIVACNGQNISGTSAVVTLPGGVQLVFTPAAGTLLP